MARVDTRERGLLPRDTIGVVVIDLSLSISDEDYNAVRRALRRLIAEDAKVGLVVFSDVAYELLPPGTPASEMQPMLRLLVPPRLGVPVNPWAQTFRAGTQVSTALGLAREMLERDEVEHGSILLVSDLETAPEDVPRLARIVDELRRSDVELRVFPLAPSSESLLIFQGLIEDDAFAAPRDPTVEAPVARETAASPPIAFLILGVLMFGALALHERLSGRLALPRTLP